MLEYCPICEENHEIVEKETLESILIMGESVEYTKRYYYCTKNSLEFLPAKILSENILKASNAYRKQKGILTSEEVKNIRNTYNLTERDIALLTDLDEKTIHCYEKGTIQNLEYDKIMKKIKNNPTYFIEKINEYKRLEESLV